MSDVVDQEPGPDANEVRRHAKKLYTESEYRRLYRRIDFYRPIRSSSSFTTPWRARSCCGPEISSARRRPAPRN